MRLTWFGLTAFGLAVAMTATRPAAGDDETFLKFSEAPAAVQKTLNEELRGEKVDTLSKDVEDGKAVYWASIVVRGRRYEIVVAEDGTLNEMGLTVDENEVKFFAIPPAVQRTFRAEARDAKIDVVSKDMKYGVTIYEAVVPLGPGGREYAIVVGEDGTLVEKVLLIDDEEIELGDAPAAVRKTLHDEAKGGEITQLVRSTGIHRPVYEAEVAIKGKTYLVEVTESGTLISKSLAGDVE